MLVSYPLRINSLQLISKRSSIILGRSLLNSNLKNQFYSTTTQFNQTNLIRRRKRSNQLTFLINRTMSASLGAPAKVLDGNAQAA